jgi:hypothetical protein
MMSIAEFVLGDNKDWASLMVSPPHEAADALKSILSQGTALLEEAETRLTTIRERIFNIRMCAFRIVSERELWKLDTDPEYEIPYKSMYRWMQVLFPSDDGLRYAMEANSTQKALPAATVADLSEMKRCNAVPLASKFVSDTCRQDRAVIEAAKTATEKQFREKLNVDHGQHLESTETLKFTYSKGDAEMVKLALGMVGKLIGIDDLSGELLALAIDYIAENRGEEAQ